jgi:hypothetical protein
VCSLLGFYAPEADVRSRSQAFLHNQGRDRGCGLSLIIDLPADITARDPSDRRTKLFGIDCGRKRCQVVGFYNSAGATQKRRYEACIEKKAGSPKIRARDCGVELRFFLDESLTFSAAPTAILLGATEYAGRYHTPRSAAVGG